MTQAKFVVFKPFQILKHSILINYMQNNNQLYQMPQHFRIRHRLAQKNTKDALIGGLYVQLKHCNEEQENHLPDKI